MPQARPSIPQSREPPGLVILPLITDRLPNFCREMETLESLDPAEGRVSELSVLRNPGWLSPTARSGRSWNLGAVFVLGYMLGMQPAAGSPLLCWTAAHYPCVWAVVYLFGR